MVTKTLKIHFSTVKCQIHCFRSFLILSSGKCIHDSKSPTIEQNYPNQTSKCYLVENLIL